MFHLDQAVTNWRRAMQQYDTAGPADVDELESHLRDDVAQLVVTGLTEEEAFLVATHRLGTPPALSAEFSKINPGLVWARRLFWMLAGYIAVSLILTLVFSVLQWISTGVMVSGLVTSPAVRLALRIAALGALAAPLLVLALVPDGRRCLVGMADRVLAWGKRRPVVMLLAALFIYLAVRALGIGRSLVMVRMAGVEAMGQEAYYEKYLSLAFAVLVPLVIMGLLGWTYRSLRGRVA